MISLSFAWFSLSVLYIDLKFFTSCQKKVRWAWRNLLMVVHLPRSKPISAWRLLEVNGELFRHLLRFSLALEWTISAELADFMGLLAHNFLSFQTKLFDLCNHARRVKWVRILSELFRCKGATLRTSLKPSKQEGVRGQVKELVLCLFAILVHRFTYNWELDKGISQEVIVLIVSVRQYK